MKHTQIKKMSKEWNTKFPFLNKNKLTGLYLTILAMVHSTKDIKMLHETLEKNQRLLRNDLINFEDFWKKYFHPSDNSKDTLEAAHNWLLFTQAEAAEGKHYNTSYYKEHIIKHAHEPETGNLVNENGLRFTSRHFMILSSQNSIGHGDGHFRTSLMENPNVERIFSLSCFLSKDKQEVIIQLAINEYDLTEELTYVLSQLPPYVASTEGCSSWGGTRIKLSYAISTKTLAHFLTEYQDPNCSGCEPYFIALEGFTDQLRFKMYDSGIRCGKIHLITDDYTYELLR